MSFQRLMEVWLREHFTRVSMFDDDRWSPSAECERIVILYFNGFRVGWISETEFAMGNSYHYSTMSNFEKLNHADPKFFDIISARLKRIGADGS